MQNDDELKECESPRAWILLCGLAKNARPLSFLRRSEVTTQKVLEILETFQGKKGSKLQLKFHVNAKSSRNFLPGMNSHKREDSTRSQVGVKSLQKKY